ncbi:hypothetical protein H5410_036787, partial [Solanum commersonii]
FLNLTTGCSPTLSSTQPTGRSSTLVGLSSSSLFSQLVDSYLPTNANEPVTKPLDYGKVFSVKVLESSFVPKDIEPIPIKSINYDDGLPTKEWTGAEVTRMNKIECLQYVICGIAGDYKIGLLRYMHILRRFVMVEDFINNLSKNTVHLNMATILKIGPNYARVRVQVDIAADLPKVVHMVVVDESTRGRRINNIKIQYDALPKY